MELEEKIKKIGKYSNEKRGEILEEFITALEQGKIRAVQKEKNEWRVNSWVKEGILACFKYGSLRRDEFTIDIDLLKRRKVFELQARFVGDGVFVRRGTYIGKGVVCMPPSFINVGAYLDSHAMIDSNVTIGSCAQIGKKTHIGAGVQIGGVLEPPQAIPVIIEDEVFVGANSCILEGVLIKQNAVIAAGTVITASTPIIDLVNEYIYYKCVPEKAVVIPGMRRYQSTPYYIDTPLIPKYRDKETSVKIAIEEALRGFVKIV